MPDEKTPRRTAGRQRKGTPGSVDRVAAAVRQVARVGWWMTRKLPGGAAAERRLLRLENAVLDEIWRRLEPADGTVGFAWRPLPATTAERGETGGHHLTALIAPMNGRADRLRAGMAELLNSSAHSDAPRGRADLHDTILRQLVPDEARIVAVLADGRPHAVVHVAVRPLGGTQRMVLEYASTVGRNAGVSVPEYVPLYVRRLHRLGVVDIGEEDPALGAQYDILCADASVLAAERVAKRTRRATVRIIRRTVVLSALGRQFWHACDPTTVDPMR